MMMREQIGTKLRATSGPIYLEVVDESYRHNIPASSESYFKVVLVSSRFTDERFLNHHHMIYSTLTEELSDTVHALVLHTYTIKEWGALRDTVFASPPCRGVGSIAQKSHLQPLAFFQHVVCRFSRNGLRAVLFCLGDAQSERFCEQI